MDALTLLRKASEAGLEVRADGERLVVRGPRRHEDLARHVLDRQDIMLFILRERETRTARGEPPLDEHIVTDSWARSASKLLASCPDPDLRSDLTDLFDETAAVFEGDLNMSRDTAEQQAFGQLLFELFKRGLDVRSMP